MMSSYLKFLILYVCFFGLLNLIIASKPKPGQLPKLIEKEGGPITRSRAKALAAAESKNRKAIEEMNKKIVAVNNSADAYKIFWEFGTTPANDENNLCSNTNRFNYVHRQSICGFFLSPDHLPLAECVKPTVEQLDSKEKTKSVTLDSILKCTIKSETAKVIDIFLLINTPKENFYYKAKREVGENGWIWVLNSIVEIVDNPDFFHNSLKKKLVISDPPQQRAEKKKRGRPSKKTGPY